MLRDKVLSLRCLQKFHFAKDHPVTISRELIQFGYIFQGSMALGAPSAPDLPGKVLNLAKWQIFREVSSKKIQLNH